jgi:tetratricopeptide (TPR) repeat protein
MKFKVIDLLFICLIFILTSCGDETKKANDINKTKQSTKVDPLKALNQKLVADPNNPNLYHERCLYFFNNAVYDKAMDDISRALSIDSMNPDFIYTKGDIFYTVMRFDDATVEFAKALKINKQHSPSNLKMARILMHLKQYKDAIKHIDVALKSNVNLAEGYFLKGIVFQYMGDSVNAASSFQTAVEQKADYYDAYVSLGLLCAMRKDSMAIEYYQSALSLRPTSTEALYNLGIYYQESGRFEKAFATYNLLNKVQPKNEGAHHNKGYMYLVFFNEKEKAIQQFDSALRINPKYVEAYHNRGLAYRESKKFKEARADFKAALGINPQYELSANELDDMDRKREK